MDNFPPQPAPSLPDVRAAGIGAVIWCTGYGSDFGWLDVPVLDGAG